MEARRSQHVKSEQSDVGRKRDESEFAAEGQPAPRDCTQEPVCGI